MELLALTLVRFVVPLSILKWPVAGLLVSMAVDALDYVFFPFQAGLSHRFYQVWDKVLDSYYQLVAVMTLWQWKEVAMRRMAQLLFGWRLLGVLLFSMTAQPLLLVIFPGVFESLFLFYHAFVKLTHEAEMALSSWQAYVTALLLAGPKLLQEYLMHIQQMAFYEMLTVTVIDRVMQVPMVALAPEPLFYMALIAGIPLLTLMWWVSERRETVAHVNA
jgi:hypothetical protein